MWPFRSRIPKLATRITVEPPEPDAQRAGLAIVLIARNESVRILDWLAFHALAGVTDVLLYDNGSTDNTVDLAVNFKGCRVRVIPWKLKAGEAKTGMQLHQQVVAYAHAVCTFGGQFERMAFIDTDEYLVPKEAMTLPEALHDLPHPNISLPWTMFGHGGHDVAPDDAVPFAFQERAPVSEGPLLNFKCIVDPCEVTCVNPHRFETKDHGNVSSNTQGTLAPNKGRGGSFVCHEVIQLNHYYLMSKQEMDAKIGGPAVSRSPHEQRKAAVLRKAALIEANPVTDQSAVAFLARHGVSGSDALRKLF